MVTRVSQVRTGPRSRRPPTRGRRPSGPLSNRRGDPRRVPAPRTAPPPAGAAPHRPGGRRPGAGPFEFWDGSALGPRGRGGDAMTCARRRAAPHPLGPGRARRRPGVRRRRHRPSRATFRRCSGSCRRLAPDSVPWAGHGPRGSGPPAGWACSGRRRRSRPRSAGRPGRLHSPPRDAAGRQPPLRRGQRLLRVGARPEHDLLLRPVRDQRDHARGGSGGQARADLPQAGPRPIGRGPGCWTWAVVGARWPSTPPATTRRQVVGVALSANRWTTPAAGGRGRPRRPGRDPAAGLPGPAR